MRILDKLFGKANRPAPATPAPPPAPAREPDYTVLLEIAGTLSGNSPAVLDPLRDCLRDDAAYFTRMRGHYEERGIDEHPGRDAACWLGMVDLLAAHHFVWEVDWKEQPAEVLSALSVLCKNAGCTEDLRELPFTPDTDVETLLPAVNSKLAPSGFAAGWIDIDSDSYILVVTQTAHRQPLSALAASIGHNILWPEPQAPAPLL